MKFTLLKRRFTVSAPRVAVRAHVPWPIRVLGGAVVLGLAAAVAMWTYDLGSRFAGFNKDELKTELGNLRKQVADLTAERESLSKNSSFGESQVAMDRAAQQQLMAQVKALEADNARLKEENSFFESLLPNTAQQGGLAIRNLRAGLEGAPPALRYRLLVMQAGKNAPDFDGTFQLVLTGTQNGRPYSGTFPEKPGADAQWRLNFKRYQRIEGVINLPEGTVVKSVQARVLQQGSQKAAQSVAVS